MNIKTVNPMRKLINLTLQLTLFLLIFSCNDKDETTPLVEKPTFSVEEQSFFIESIAKKGSCVGKVVTKTDAEEANFTYSISKGNNNNAFAISPQDGEITVKNPEAIDYAVNPIFNLTIAVKSSKYTVSAKVTIKVLPLDKELVLYMPFNDNLEDISLQKNNATLNENNAKIFVKGKKGNALDFNGSTDYVVLSDTIDSSNGLSFSFWIYKRATLESENTGAIVSKYSMKGKQKRDFVISTSGAGDTHDNNFLSGTFYKSKSVHEFIRSDLKAIDLEDYSNPELWTIAKSTELPLEKWAHCVVNVTDIEIQTWIDGVLCTKKTREVEQYNASSELIYIGNCRLGGEGSNNHFNGILDELRIYRRALTEEEIGYLSDNANLVKN